MKALARSLAFAALGMTALAAHAADPQAAFVGQNEAGPIPNPHYVAQPAQPAANPQYLGQNEAGPIPNPAFETAGRNRDQVREAARSDSVTPATRFDPRYAG